MLVVADSPSSSLVATEYGEPVRASGEPVRARTRRSAEMSSSSAEMSSACDARSAMLKSLMPSLTSVPLEPADRTDTCWPNMADESSLPLPVSRTVSNRVTLSGRVVGSGEVSSGDPLQSSNIVWLPNVGFITVLSAAELVFIGLLGPPPPSWPSLWRIGGVDRGRVALRLPSLSALRVDTRISIGVDCSERTDDRSDCIAMDPPRMEE